MTYEFFNWLTTCYSSRDLTIEEIEEAISDTSKAYDLFMECWACDMIGTGELAQKELSRFRSHLKMRLKGKDNETNAEVGSAILQ